MKILSHGYSLNGGLLRGISMRCSHGGRITHERRVIVGGIRDTITYSDTAQTIRMEQQQQSFTLHSK
ncbi:hypothetical protein [Chitinivibrio alkaliphilus]|uniref:Uncharacterized protein n=1 Tax=Chitinivibrio alkaliphilus ACht1 TaxID=1313304 RepID=U7D8F9_9BACT|nr:hypothetical protein [Chitinivibrio alkaliphilus]ERP39250.1 hypothetical protein CALK_0041 [Chitinivibrio alkaliphilus ACht1]